MFEKIAARPVLFFFWLGLAGLFKTALDSYFLIENGGSARAALVSAFPFYPIFFLLNALGFWLQKRNGWAANLSLRRWQVGFSLAFLLLLLVGFVFPFLGWPLHQILRASMLLGILSLIVFLIGQFLFFRNVMVKKGQKTPDFISKRPEKALFLLISLAFLPLVFFIAAAFFHLKIEVEDFGGTIFFFTFFGAFLLLAAYSSRKNEVEKINHDGIRAHFWLTFLGMFLFVFAETVLAPAQPNWFFFTLLLMLASLVFFILGQVVIIRNFKKAAAGR